MAGSWLVGWPKPTGPDPRPTLLCLPPAGAGARQFAPWQTALGGVIRVLGVQLPGRENRWRDRMPDTFDDAVAAIAAEVRAQVDPAAPLVVFGHSFGGLIGFALSGLLWSPNGPPGPRPSTLVVSACRPPAHWEGAGLGLIEDGEALTDIFDPGDLLSQVIDEDTRAALLAVLRADAELSLSYSSASGKPLEIAVHAWGADGDVTVTAEQMDGWAEYTDGPYTRSRIGGGHHALLREPEQLLSSLSLLLQPDGLG
jgi:surfactin synthase thioesterase subunit